MAPGIIRGPPKVMWEPPGVIRGPPKVMWEPWSQNHFGTPQVWGEQVFSCFKVGEDHQVSNNDSGMFTVIGIEILTDLRTGRA